MPFAITLRLDNAAAHAVSNLWRILAAQGLSCDALLLGYPAHLPLAPENAIVSAVEALDNIGRMTVPLSSFGVFVEMPPLSFQLR